MSTISPLENNPFAYLEGGDLSNLSFDNYTELLAIPKFRNYITRKRWDIFEQSGVPLQVFQDGNVGIIDTTIPYNIEGIKNSINSLGSLERSELVFRPLMAMDRIYSYGNRSVFPELTALLIGSRTEYEVLLGLSYGFQLENMAAVDLISYSPWITPGDMHNLPFDDNTFDIIVLGWVLGYSSTPGQVANEVLRVARSGCIVSIGNDCYTEESLRASQFYSAQRPNTVKAITDIFGQSVADIVFAHEPRYTRGDVPGFTGHLITTFEVRK